MNKETTPGKSNSSSSLTQKAIGKMRRKLGGRVSAKAAPEAPKAKLTTKREFLTLLFPKQKKPGTSLKKRAGGKGQLTRRKKLLEVHAAQIISSDAQQPVKLKNELTLDSQESPLQQTASRRKFIKLAGMTAAAAALWRRAVALEYKDTSEGSWNICSGTSNFSSGYYSQAAQDDVINHHYGEFMATSENNYTEGDFPIIHSAGTGSNSFTVGPSTAITINSGLGVDALPIFHIFVFAELDRCRIQDIIDNNGHTFNNAGNIPDCTIHNLVVLVDGSPDDVYEVHASIDWAWNQINVKAILTVTGKDGVKTTLAPLIGEWSYDKCGLA